MLRSPVSQLDDSRLAARVRAGNETAFEVLYDRHHRSLLSFCRHMLGSAEDGEDALQQTMVRAHRALVGGGPLPDAVRPWLFAIARNRCKTMLAARREACVPMEDFEVAFDGLADDVRRRADLRELVGDLARLPEDQRGALVLFELGGLSQAEIAVAIGVPAGKVKALVYQARSELMAERDARATPCTSVREELAVARGGALRRGPLKRHLRLCDGCRAYHAAVASQRAGLASILPVTPALGLKASVLAAAVGGGGSAAGGMGAGAAGAGVAAKGGVAALGAATATATGGGTVAALVAKVAVTAAVVGGGAIGGAAAVDHAAQPAGVPVAATVTASPTPSPVRTVVARERTVDRPPPAPKAKATATPVTTTAAATVAATATPTTRATRAPKARKASVRLRRALHRRRARLSAGRSDAGGGSELVVEVGPTRTVRPPQPRPTKPVVRKPKHKRPVVSEGSSPAQTGTSPAATPTPPPVTPVPRPRRPHRAPTPAPTPPPVVATPEPTPEATPTPEPPPAETPAPTPTPTPTP